jgi:hypothetical protein
MQTQNGFTWQGYTAGRSVECSRFGKGPGTEAPGKSREETPKRAGLAGKTMTTSRQGRGRR